MGRVARDVLSRRRRPVLFHARSYVPAAAAASLARAFRAPWIFDMRGFWFDEKVDAGSQRAESVAYRVARRAERVLFSSTDAVVSLTRASEAEVAARGAGPPRRFRVIPTCVDLAAFAVGGARDGARAPLIGYLGSLGPRYLVDDMLRLFAAVRARRSDAMLRILSAMVDASLFERAAAHGIPRGALDVRTVPFEAVPAELSEMDATLCLVEPGRSSSASCPTKFGESLAVGRPVVVNPGVGDCADIVREERVGVVFDPRRDDVDEAAMKLLALLGDPDVARRCRLVAERDFALSAAVDRYDALYRELLGFGPGQGTSARAGG
jgi:glycosyltransferase involved in cell wall biosynthesis